MESLVSLNSIAKSFGPKNLFSNLSISFFKGEACALIGRNGAGKSSLLKIIAGLDEADTGDVVRKKNLRLEYVGQSPSFPPHLSAQELIENHLRDLKVSEEEISYLPAIALSQCEFTDFDQKISTLSGGWIKRLAIAKSIASEPDILLLDEPTNHMDWEGIEWLIGLLKQNITSYIVISHDRYFLNQVCKRTVELGPAFENAYLAFDKAYDDFLVARQDYMDAQAKQIESLSNKAARELDWLRAGVKARTTKSSARMQEAHQLLDKLGDSISKQRQAGSKISLQIDSTDRKTKKLIELIDVSKSFGEKKLFSEISFVVSPKTRLALVGDNGSGKSTLVKIIMDQVPIDEGQIKRAENLKIIYFDQHKVELDNNSSIFQFLGDGSDHVQLSGRPMHVASYASKFLFGPEHFHLKISQLSGGEKARLQLAKILLNPCDLLILDEPTNDLDIDSLNILEDLLSDLDIAVILISHDRSFVQNVATHFLSLEGNGAWNFYADLEQALKHKSKNTGIEPETSPKSLENSKKSSNKNRNKLSNKERTELANMESEIQTLEKTLALLQEDLQKPEVSSNHKKLLEVNTEITSLEKAIQKKFERWQELEEK